MAELVAAFVMPHAPGMATDPELPPLPQRQACFDAFATIRRRVQELSVDTVIVVGDDHYTLHSPACIPSALIGIGEVEGPAEAWLRLPRTRVQNNPALAQHIMRYGHQSAEHPVDWAAAKTMTLDHSAYLPHHFAVAGLDGVRTVPIYLNSGVDPLIGSRRSYHIGQSIGAAIASAPGRERVAIYGTGGISHWPGMAQMGQVNSDWDACVIGLVEQGGVEELIGLGDQAIVDAAGNGAWEIKNWLCAMGAMSTQGTCRGHLITYQAVKEWVTGCGYMELKAAWTSWPP